MSEQYPGSVVFDCDDVLTPCGPILRDIFNTMYGTDVQLADIYNSPPEVWGASTADEAQGRVETCMRIHAGEFLVPYPEAVPVVKRLARTHELHVVTGRRDFMEPITRRMIEEFFPGCFKTVEHTNYFAPSDEAHLRRSKGEVCRRLGARVLVDDHFAHAASALDCGLKAILFGNYEWNQLDDLPLGMVRCRDWQDLGELMEEFSMPEAQGVVRG